MKYTQFVDQLKSCAEEDFAAFQRKLIPTKQQILGVRTPTMRQMAKVWQGKELDLFAFPDTYFEVTFIKLAAISKLPFKQFSSLVEDCVQKMDNWATCDCFKAPCIQKNKREFLNILKKIFEKGEEFSQRYALVSLLYYYIEEEYSAEIEYFIQNANTDYYYVHMATAWLIAEVLIKNYDYGLQLLKNKIVEEKTHNKAIQKAIESYRLTQQQKEYLRSLKIKNK